MKSFAFLAITAAMATTAVSAYQQEGGHEDKHGGHVGHHNKPDLSGPGIQVETRPPVVVVTTVTLSKPWNARPTGKPHWRSNKHYHEDKDEYEEEEEEHEEHEGGKKKWGGKHGGKHGGKYGSKHGDDEDDEGKDDEGKDDEDKDDEGKDDEGKDDDDKDDEDKDDEDKDDEDKDDLHANSLAYADGLDVEAAGASGLVDFVAAQASGGMVSSAIASRSSSVASRVTSAIASASSSAAAAASPNAGESVRVGGTFVAAAAGIAAYLLL